MAELIIALLNALVAGWMIGDAIRDFQKKRYYHFSIDATLAIVAYIVMIINIRKR